MSWQRPRNWMTLWIATFACTVADSWYSHEWFLPFPASTGLFWRCESPRRLYLPTSSAIELWTTWASSSARSCWSRPGSPPCQQRSTCSHETWSSTCKCTGDPKLNRPRRTSDAYRSQWQASLGRRAESRLLKHPLRCFLIGHIARQIYGSLPRANCRRSGKGPNVWALGAKE